MHLVLQNFFECMFMQSVGDDASSAHKSLMATAVGTADAKTMEKFAHVAEKFVHKSVVAALAPYKEAVMRFQQVQLDTVGDDRVRPYVLHCARAHVVLRCASETLLMPPTARL